MNKNGFYGFILTMFAFVTGCSASANGPAAKQPSASGVDGRRAVNTTTGDCDKSRPGVSDADFAACVQSNKVINIETGACESGHPGTSDADLLVCYMRRDVWLSATPHVAAPQLPKEGQPLPPMPQGPAATQALPLPPATPAPPANVPPPGYYPMAVGPTCEVQNGITFEVTNNSDYYLEVSNPGAQDPKHRYIIPLNCDAPLTTELIPVQRKKSGVIEDGVIAIKPHETAKFVFMPLNGGWGKGIKVTVTGWMQNPVRDGSGRRLPSSEVGTVSYRADVPNPNGEANRVTVDSFRLQ